MGVAPFYIGYVAALSSNQVMQIASQYASTFSMTINLNFHSALLSLAMR
jgi:hypothetical protein